jgi:alkanesulfonate monooxygenase SsuD/methylene tetrahydromethanopterin reductase-like flavin-dependent oxidoreductase (luciferase family)
MSGVEMQFGIFSVGDVTPDPTTGRSPSEAERIAAMVAIALRTEAVGMDVFATGEHHNPPFFPSSPTTMLGFIAARTERLILSTATTLITTNDPVKIAEGYAMLQHLAGGRVDLMLGRGNMGPVYGGQVFMRANSQDAVREFRPYFDHAPVYGGGPSLEEFMADTPLTVGSPQQVIDRTLAFRETVGDYQRQLFLVDHAGLPLASVLEQLDMLGELVVPVLRREFAARRAPNVPEAPLHPRVQAAQAARSAEAMA